MLAYESNVTQIHYTHKNCLSDLNHSYEFQQFNQRKSSQGKNIKLSIKNSKLKHFIHLPTSVKQITCFKKEIKRNNLLLFPVNEANKGIIQKL